MTAPDQPTATSPPAKKPKFHSYPFWSPRFWHGMRLLDWLRLLIRNRFRIHPLRVPMAVLVTLCALFNSFLHLIERLRYGRRIAETEITQPPVFIIGHWRSGTTHLHELMVRDDRFAFPTTYECMTPSHFLVSDWILPKLTGFLLPAKRPMDNMIAGFDRPQEDEFALIGLGAPTPYFRLAFPNDPPAYFEFLDMEGAKPADLTKFKQEMRAFVQRLTLQKEKRLILKSPPHTGRMQVLSEIFPGAIFVHIVRDPYAVFASTKRLWQALDDVQGFQLPKKDRDLNELVLSAFERMYRGFERQRPLLGPQHLCEVKYEELVRDPLGQLATIYERMQLGDFTHVRPQIEAYMRDQKDYQTNRHEELPPALKAEIRRRWAGYFERYGYA